MDEKIFYEIDPVVQNQREKTGKILSRLRKLLDLSKDEVYSATGVSTNTIRRIENAGSHGVTDKNVLALIFFYGYNPQKFYSLSEVPKSKKELINQMKHFHQKFKSTHYQVVYNKLISTPLGQIKNELRSSKSLFDNWVSKKEIEVFFFKKRKYTFTNLSDTLSSAAKAGFLLSKKDKNAQNKNFNVYKKGSSSSLHKQYPVREDTHRGCEYSHQKMGILPSSQQRFIPTGIISNTIGRKKN